MRAVVLAVALMVTACGRVAPPQGVCDTAADCTDSAAPYCIDRKCAASCEVNTDCSDASRAICATDGACVGCVQDPDCSAAAPVCDMAERACRGCSKDAECSSGVCIEADGTCAAEPDVAFVTMMGADTGTCTRQAPCTTLEYAIAHAGTRKIIHVLGGSISTSGTLALTTDLTLDGEDTIFGSGGATPIAISGTAHVTIEGFRVSAPTAPAGMTPPPAITVGNGSHATLQDMLLSGDGSTLVSATGNPEVVIRHSHLGSLSQNTANMIACNGAKLTLDQNVLEMTIVGSFMPCEITLTRNRFESSRDGSVQVTGGQLVMENNLIIHRDGFNDSMSVSNLRSGSTIRFNTIVNTTAAPSDGSALGCDGSVVVTSNIFAYNSGHPITGSCETRYSIFDDQATTAAGTGNQVTTIDAIFVNRGAGDYHLAAASKARGASEPGQTMVTTDFDGLPRPSPAGSTSDSGAFEAP